MNYFLWHWKKVCKKLTWCWDKVVLMDHLLTVIHDLMFTDCYMYCERHLIITFNTLRYHYFCLRGKESWEVAELGFESRFDWLKSPVVVHPGCALDSLGNLTGAGEVLLHGLHFLQYKLTVINSVHVWRFQYLNYLLVCFFCLFLLALSLDRSSNFWLNVGHYRKL